MLGMTLILKFGYSHADQAKENFTNLINYHTTWRKDHGAFTKSTS